MADQDGAKLAVSLFSGAPAGSTSASSAPGTRSSSGWRTTDRGGHAQPQPRAVVPAARRGDPLDITTLDPEDVLKLLALRPGELDLLVGGPPCVAFSKSGFHLEYKRQGRDPKANLLEFYLDYLKALQPKAFLMENVFGLAYRNQSAAFFEALCEGITKAGYSLTYGVLNAADYGVPQNRQRLFLIGSHDGTQLEPRRRPTGVSTSGGCHPRTWPSWRRT